VRPVVFALDGSVLEQRTLRPSPSPVVAALAVAVGAAAVDYTGVAGAAVVLVAVPGPNLLYVVTRSAGEGRAAGIASGSAAAIGLASDLL
jgi:threonine/homoserine/homoserine lactone efflux protein